MVNEKTSPLIKSNKKKIVPTLTVNFFLSKLIIIIQVISNYYFHTSFSL